MRRAVATAFAMAVLASLNTAAKAEMPMQVQGTIMSFTAPVLVVRATDGRILAVTLKPEAKIVASEKSSSGAIKPNDFVSSSGGTDKDGTLGADELRILPDALRGMGEGQYPWEGTDRRLTNATVLEIVPGEGKSVRLKLGFHGSVSGSDGRCSGHATAPGQGPCNGQSEITLGAKVPVTRWLLADTALLEPGKSVSLIALKANDGTLSSFGVIVAPGAGKSHP